MARSVPEWIGKTPDSKAPKSVKLRVFDVHGGRCHISGLKINVGQKWEMEHIIPLSMGGENRESNLAPALVEPHKQKTAQEDSDRSKMDKARARHIGLKTRSNSWGNYKKKLNGTVERIR